MKFLMKTAFFISIFLSVLFLLQCERINIFEKALGSENSLLSVVLTGDDYTDENGKSTTIEVKLSQEPAEDVSVFVSLSSSEVTISPSTYNISTTSWDTAFVVTVTGFDDDNYDEDSSTPYTVTVETSSSDTDFNDLKKEVDLNNYSYDRYIFITGDTSEGSFGSVSAADDLCKDMGATIDNTLTYKAVIVDGSSRTASTSEGQLDWVLIPNGHYYRSDKSSFGYTNDDAYFIFDDSLYPMGQLTPAAVDIWTGLATDWSTALTCSSWTGSGDGAYGNSASTDDSLIYSGDMASGSSSYFLCVQQ